jgi:tetraacyldisaccharide 4'-kinase
MTSDSDHYFRNVMSGSQKGASAAGLRLATAAVEPFYSGVTLLRNRLYDAGVLRTASLGKPTISIGNLTAGGTGKTPMVRWLAAKLRERGRQVAVLSRGYKTVPGQLGDEQRMLDAMLNGAGNLPVVIQANPDRAIAAAMALKSDPGVDLFLLDDGFQHRRVSRDLDIVLLNATEPFGFGHVLPRGLLREPVGGIRRASAVVITHADRVDESALAEIERRVRRYHSDVPIFRAVHQPSGLRTARCPNASPADRTLNELREKRIYAFCGLGNPEAFGRQIESLGGTLVGKRWFSDHHAYSADDLKLLMEDAGRNRADLLVTTEKDWIKVGELVEARASAPPIWRIDVELQFQGDGAAKLLELIEGLFSKTR